MRSRSNIVGGQVDAQPFEQRYAAVALAGRIDRSHAEPVSEGTC